MRYILLLLVSAALALAVPQFIKAPDFVSYALPVKDHSPCHEKRETTSILDSESHLGSSPASSLGLSQLSYPLSLFDIGIDPLPSGVTEDLTDLFRDCFSKTAHFIRRLSQGGCLSHRVVTSVPLYLKLAKALIGTIMSQRSFYGRWTPTLYVTAVKQFVGAVEMGNRTSKNP